MRRPAAFLLLAMSCGSAGGAMEAGRILTADEISRARSAEPHGDAVLVLSGREYVDAAIVGVRRHGRACRPHADGPHDRSSDPRCRRHVGRPAGDGARAPRERLGLHPRAEHRPSVPRSRGRCLQRPGLVGFTPTELHMRAEPDGLFVASVSLGHEDGRLETATLHGRLIGGCEMGGGPDGIVGVADPSTVPLCDDVMGAC